MAEVCSRLVASVRSRPRASRSTGRHGLSALLLVVAVLSGLWPFATVAPASASVPPIPGGGQPTDEGSVTVTDPNGLPLAGGTGVTLYSLDLPDGAACPGDSASQNWYVQGFLVPADDDPGVIEYGVIGPEGDQFPLFAYDTKPYAHQLTQVASSPGAPGIIPMLPALTFGVFTPGYIPPGRYRIGVACTFYRQTARYWDTEIVIEADSSDEVAGIRWSVPDAPAGAVREGDEGGWSIWFTLALVLGVTALGVAVLALRSRSLWPAPTSPSSPNSPSSPTTPTNATPDSETSS